MNSQKFALGSLAGGIVFFFLGYLFYGVLLKNFFAENNSGAPVNMDTMVWWALIVGNLFSGVLLAYILGKANVRSAGGGAGTGFVVGLLMGLSYDLIRYGVEHTVTLKAVAADIAVAAVISALAGAVIGWVLGTGKKGSLA